MFKFLKVAAATVVIFAGAAQAEELRMGTASVGGAFYPMGQSISNLVTNMQATISLWCQSSLAVRCRTPD